MIVRRYFDPITEINALRRQINDVFGDLTSETMAQSDWSPAIRLVDTGDDFVLTVHLAGVNATNVEAQVSSDAVSVSGRHLQPEVNDSTKVLYDDARYGYFHRVVNLPDAVQNDKAVADFSHGLLTLTLPKVVEARNKVVKINLGAKTEAPAIEATDVDANTES